MSQFTSLDDLHSSLVAQGKRYLTLIKQLTPDAVLIRVTDGHRFWELHFDQACVAQLRAKIQLEGSLDSFCQLVALSLNTSHYEIQSHQDSLTITFIFALDKAVHLRAPITLLQVQDEPYEVLNQSFMYDLYDTLTKTYHLPKSSTQSKSHSI